MHTKNIRIIPAGLLGALLWLAPVWMLVATSCDSEPVKVSVTMEQDYSQIIEAIQSANQTLTDKMSLIESALTKGFADNTEARELLRQAIESLSGSAAEKLAAIETAIKNQTASLEIKLGLIEAAIAGGFADAAAGQELLQAALQSLSGTADEKLSLIEAAVESQTASLETKLGLIEAAIKSGLADASTQQELILTALESLLGTLDQKLSLIEAAIKSQTVSLETKLGLIEQSVSQGLADNQKSLKLIQEALEALNGTLARKLASLESAIRSETTGLESKLDLIKTAVGTGLADASQQEDMILQAVEALNGTLDDKLKAISTAIANQQRDLDIKLGLIQAAIEKGLTNHAQAQALIQEAIVAINGNASAKLEAITATVSKQTTSLWAKLELIGTAFNTGLADAATALGQIYQALKSINDESVASIVSRFALLESIMDDRLPKTLENIFAAVESMPDYRHILGAINWALYKCTEHSIGGYEYVEMAPGLKWATMNVGATSPEEIGIYYAWGELNIKNKDAYTWNNYKFWAWDSEHSDKPEQFFITKYTFEDKVYDARWYGWGESGFTGDDITWLGKPVAGYDFADDVARQDWGSSWRIPTEKEWAALCDTLQYEWTWIDDYNGSGTAGVQITSWAAGCEGYQIFLPAAGRKDGTVNETDWNGYWSSMLAGVSFEADACFFNASEHHMSSEIENIAAIPLPKRYLGLQVRPVSE